MNTGSIKKLDRVLILTPVYNDWPSFYQLCSEIEALNDKSGFQIERIIAVNDGSGTIPTRQKNNLPVTILNLNANIGHQRAIAIGLSFIGDQLDDHDAIIVMDSDGEDRPEDITYLIKDYEDSDDARIVFASRKKRSEGIKFRLFYGFFKLIFRTLTGRNMNIGNFSCIPRSILNAVISQPDLWNHYSGSIVKSKLPFSKVPTDRGRRYEGSSKMNIQSLMLHGFSAIAIYLDVVSVRLLLFTLLSSIILVGGFLFVIYLALFTDLTIPGWSSTAGLLLLNILAISLLTTFLILLFQLNQKNVVKMPPVKFYKDFILSIDNI